MSNWSVNPIIIIGLCGIGSYVVLMYTNVFPLKPSLEGTNGQIANAWITLSSLGTGVGIIIKLIKRVLYHD